MHDAIIGKLESMVEKLENLVNSLDRRGIIVGLGYLEEAIACLNLAKEELEEDSSEDE